MVDSARQRQQHDGRRTRGQQRALRIAAARACASAAARSATITAKGLCGRCLRSRSRATASALVASQASWKPPKPLMRHDLPRRAADRAACAQSRRPARPRRRALRHPAASGADRRPGRRWAGRESAGRAGRRTRAGRPGTWERRAWWCAAGRRARPSMMVKRGPQLVQLVNG